MGHYTAEIACQRVEFTDLRFVWCGDDQARTCLESDRIVRWDWVRNYWYVTVSTIEIRIDSNRGFLVVLQRFWSAEYRPLQVGL